MKKLNLLLAFAMVSTACSILEVGALNPAFLDPVHDRLFRNDFQRNDFQFLFDATNQTVAIRSFGNSINVDSIYSLSLVSNPLNNQGIYRMVGSTAYNGQFLGLEYSPAPADQPYQAKIVIQSSEVKAREALNTWTTNVYLGTVMDAPAFYKMGSVHTWARVSATGIYNDIATDHYSFIYNDDVGVVLEPVPNHRVIEVNISGITTNSSEYIVEEILYRRDSSGGVVSVRNDAISQLSYLGFQIVSDSAGFPTAKVTRAALNEGIPASPEGAEAFYRSTIDSTSLFNFIPLGSEDRPDLSLAPLRQKGPWVFVRDTIFNPLNTTNWDFSLQDQSVTVTVYSSSGTVAQSQTSFYALRTTANPSVFQLVSSAGGALNGLYFSYKMRFRNAEEQASGIERASFYLEPTEAAAAQHVSSAIFADNYVNIFRAGSLANSRDFQLKISPSAALAHSVQYTGQIPALDATFGATVFTREDAGREFVYVMGGSHETTILSEVNGMYQINVANPQNALRRQGARTSSFGSRIGSIPGWEPVDFTLSDNTKSMVVPFGGLYAWVGSRLFLYNPAKYASIPAFDTSIENGTVSPHYRLVSTRFATTDWDLGFLPSDLTNRVHASFFSSQGVLVVAGGQHYTPRSHIVGTPAPAAGVYTTVNEVWQSYNEGSSWTKVPDPVNAADRFSPRYMATTLNVGSEVFLLGGYTDASTFSPEIWRTSDNGNTWSKVNGSLPAALIAGYSTHASGRMPGFVVNNVMYLVAANSASSDIYSSKDGGLTWAKEAQVDIDNAGNMQSRENARFGSSYVWSVNNNHPFPADGGTTRTFKGVLFQIGGYRSTGDTFFPHINAHRRQLVPR